MQIRTLGPRDIDEMIPMAVAFYEEQNPPGEMDVDVFKENWLKWWAAGFAIVVGAFIDGKMVGAAGGLLVKAANDGAMEANEMFWYVYPEYRARMAGLSLLTAWEAACANAGARRISMIRLCSEDGERIGSWLERKGYRPVEVHYYKVLED